MLNYVVDTVNREDLTQDEMDAVCEFEEMYENIFTLKGGSNDL